MRVLFLVEDAKLNGGTEILARNLAEAFCEAGIVCKLVSAADLRGKGSLKKAIEKAAVEYRADWIVSHTYDLCAEIPTDGPWKTAQVFNWSVVGYEEAYLRGIKAKPFARRILSRVKFELLRWRWHRSLHKFTKLIVLTEAGKSEIHSVDSRINSKQLVAIPDPLMQKGDSNKISSLRNKRLVFVGRLSGEKGVMRLLSIWKKIRIAMPEYSLAIYGTGPLRGEMESYINEQAVQGVSFKGFEKDIESIYLPSDLCLMTSDTEGFGMVLVEAMYYGVPCVSFDCPISPKEIIDKTGLIVPCFDEEAYARAAVGLLKAPARLKEYQSAAIRRARAFYVTNVMNIWKKALS